MSTALRRCHNQVLVRISLDFADQPVAVETGTRLGRYEVLGRIGAGAMSEVYKAKDTRLDRAVAIKVLPSHLRGDDLLRERFEREARIVSSLNHPHICRLYDVGRENSIDFIVMEHIEGETLADRIEKGALPLDQALRYASQIADALNKIHRQGVVHRDLKPANIMLTDSQAKLLDFGLARCRPDLGAAGAHGSAPAAERKPLTAEGSILGTLQYMAPEQLEGREADPRSDIFAFGAVLYEMVTGRRAFEATSQASLIAAILRDEPPPISPLQAGFPSALDRVIRGCLIKRPEARWQSTADLLAELERTSAEAGPSASKSRPTASGRMLVFGMAAAAVLFLTGIAVRAVWGPKAPRGWRLGSYHG